MVFIGHIYILPSAYCRAVAVHSHKEWEEFYKTVVNKSLHRDAVHKVAVSILKPCLFGNHCKGLPIHKHKTVALNAQAALHRERVHIQLAIHLGREGYLAVNLTRKGLEHRKERIYRGNHINKILHSNALKVHINSCRNILFALCGIKGREPYVSR